jgi:hypothetical protein
MTREQLIEALTELGEECTPNGLMTEGTCLGLLVALLGNPKARGYLARAWPQIVALAMEYATLADIRQRTNQQVIEERQAEYQATLN